MPITATSSGGASDTGRPQGFSEVGPEVLRATAVLTGAGVTSPRCDAERLTAHVLGVRLHELSPGSLAAPAQVHRLRELVERRAARVPLQHLLGTATFRRLELFVGPGVYVPVPETEAVAGAVLAHLRTAEQGSRPVVVDLCTGSGSIALAVADEAPTAVVHAVEADPAAFAWTQRNRDHLALPVELHLASVQDAVHHLDGTVDVVVSNPPYVAVRELPRVEPEVRDHDPLRALVAGPDGLSMIRAVEEAAWRLLRPGGLVVVEHSDRQGTAAPQVFAPRWTRVVDHVDQEGRDRYVTAFRPSR